MLKAVQKMLVDSCADRLLDTGIGDHGEYVNNLEAIPQISCTNADRLLDTGNQDTIMKMFKRFPKAGAGVARLQVCAAVARCSQCTVRCGAAAQRSEVVHPGWKCAAVFFS